MSEQNENADRRTNAETNDDRLRHYADSVYDHQENHAALMAALRDDSLGLDDFNKLSDDLRKNLNRIKQLREDLTWHRRNGRDSATDEDSLRMTG